MEKVGIENIEKVLEALRIVAVEACEAADEGKVEWTEAVAAAIALFRQRQKLIDAGKSVPNVPAEATDIDSDEAKRIVAIVIAMYNDCVKALQPGN